MSRQSWGPAVLRVIVGSVFVAHGLPKLIPIWGGSPSATAVYFEALAGLALVAGFYTLWAAVALASDVALTIWKAHLPHGFFLNWTLASGVGHGYEFHLVLLGALACLMLAGPGALSIDGRRARFAESEAAGRARLLKSRA